MIRRSSRMHRHLEVAPGTPPAKLPAAAVADLLERGDLDDWRPLARAIAREPEGILARRVLALAGACPMYGTSPLWRAWIEHRRDLAEGARGPRHAPHPAARPRPRPLSLAALRRSRGLTQVGLAARMHISQSDLSKLEHRRDLRLSTLQALARALGARLRTVIRFRDGSEVEVRPGALHPPRRAGAPCAKTARQRGSRADQA